MHSNYKPLSSISTDVTAANFPALKHFWPCTESTEDTALTDIVGGVVTGAVNIIASDGNKITCAQASANVPIASGTLQAPGDKVAVIFGIGNFASAGILGIGVPQALGGAGGFQINQPLSLHRATDATTTADTATAVFGSAPEGHALVFDRAAALTGYRIQSNLTYAVNGTPDTTGLPNITALEQATAFGNALAGTLADFHGAIVFYFDATPPDLEIALQWMYNKWINGEKEIYPGWKDLV